MLQGVDCGQRSRHPGHLRVRRHVGHPLPFQPYLAGVLETCQELLTGANRYGTPPNSSRVFLFTKEGAHSCAPKAMALFRRQGLLVVPFPFRGGTRWGCSLVVHKDVVCQHFTLTPALSLKGEGELKDPGYGGDDLTVPDSVNFPAILGNCCPSCPRRTPRSAACAAPNRRHPSGSPAACSTPPALRPGCRTSRGPAPPRPRAAL